MAADIPATLVDALAELGAGTLSSVELTAACIDRARAAQPRLTVFISLEADSALAAARASDEARAALDKLFGALPCWRLLTRSSSRPKRDRRQSSVAGRSFRVLRGALAPSKESSPAPRISRV